MLSKKIFWLYLAALHLLCLALLVLVVKDRYLAPPDDNWHNRLHSFYLRYDQNVPNDSLVFLGDSHIQGMCTTCVSKSAINFGIGKDRTADVIRRVTSYQSVKTAKAVVLQVGHNDLKSDSNAKIVESYDLLLRALTGDQHILVVAQFPVGVQVEHFDQINVRKRQINEAVQNLCTLNKQCTMLDLTSSLTDKVGTLSSKYHLGDGVHLNKNSNALWIDSLRETLVNME
ncbi:MAG: lysophospholipase L1-like esterase [Candidatus Azotimanducaceae bacterium]